MSLGFILVVIAAFSLGVQRFFSRAGFGAYINSVSFLVVGLALGQFGLNILSSEAMSLLQPFVSLLMGMLGFILGLPIRHAVRVSRFAPTALWASMGMGAAVGSGMYALLHWVPALSGLVAEADQLWVTIAVGAASTAVSTPIVYFTVHRLHAKGPVSESLFSFAVVSNILAVVVAGGGLAVSRALESDGGAMLTKTEWLVTCSGIGIACGILYTLFLGKGAEESTDRTFLATVAIVVFASGLAAAMGVSPLLVNLFAGLTTSVLYRKTDSLYNVLQGLFEPAGTVLAILAGAMWTPPPLYGWFLAAAYFILRPMGAYVFGEIAVRSADPKLRINRFGTGIWAQGILAIAVAVNFTQVNPHLSSIVLTIVLFSVLAGDLLSPGFLKKLIMDSGEIPTETAAKRGHQKESSPSPSEKKNEATV